MKIRPIGDNILLRRLPAAGVSSLLHPTDTFTSRLELPEAWKAKSNRGLVIATGRGSLSLKGHLRPANVKAGDIVVFDHRAGSEITLAQPIGTLLILKENEILGVEP